VVTAPPSRSVRGRLPNWAERTGRASVAGRPRSGPLGAPVAGAVGPERLAREVERRPGLPGHLVHDLDDLRELLGELLADDRVGLLLERLGALGDRLGLGEALASASSMRASRCSRTSTGS
jgi:hypothetical protein